MCLFTLKNALFCSVNNKAFFFIAKTNTLTLFVLDFKQKTQEYDTNVILFIFDML